ncbi:hypothetical protein PACTADRAFT_2300 [Pachysolen tannophilus NRRL Y-2460]|uniref:Acetyltransferase component of pyruvate dehydrogenase complex n=1 Tax=Pachysolen tannophilus NRRL Y-2460 TaxID=669874 RepID=A0A1E4TWG0_PACTA|nr:hypothetical protein PACTADRAFT_2300 [Pachysolen tannophilus NRRL Y-2460]
MSALTSMRIGARPAFHFSRQLPRFQGLALNLARTYAGKSFPDHVVIKMPALSPTMTQGSLLSWSKKVGDKLNPGEAIAEIETDKASMDFEFQEEGYLAKILVEGGAKDLPVGKPIAVYVEEEGDVAAFADFTAEDAGDSGDSGAAAAPPAQASSEAAPAKEETTPQKEEPAPAKKASQAEAPSAPPAGGRIIASPLAKTIALEKGISLKNIKGTGPKGRIVADDVRNYKPPATAGVTGAGAGAGAPGAAPSASYEDIPITSMRSTIAKRLLQSTQSSPTYIVSSAISVSKLLKLRQSLNATAEDRYKLSVNDLMLKAVAVTARRMPQVNSVWLENEGIIRQYKNVDVSVAVATPTGLITPIVKNADTKGLIQISTEVKDLGKRAKENKLKPEEFVGGTITISNLGMNHAVSLFTSIINPPHSAILAIATVQKVAVEDKSNPNGFVFDEKINVTGTFDHRTVDGALGGEFIKELKRVVENPLEFLL